MLAFEKAIEAGADRIEFDLRASQDGTVFVHHDATVDRTTNGEGFLHEMTAEEVKQLEAGSWFDSQFAGEPIPTFEDVLDHMRDRILLTAEVKVSGIPTSYVHKAIDNAVEAVEKRNMFDQVLFISFSLDALVQIKARQPEAATALLDWNKQQYFDLQQTVLSIRGQGWLPHGRLATKERVAAARKRGLLVISGAGNDKKTREETVMRMYNLGVDFISTNYPAEVIDVLTEGPQAPCRLGP